MQVNPPAGAVLFTILMSLHILPTALDWIGASIIFFIHDSNENNFPVYLLHFSVSKIESRQRFTTLVRVSFVGKTGRLSSACIANRINVIQYWVDNEPVHLQSLNYERDKKQEAFATCLLRAIGQKKGRNQMKTCLFVKGVTGRSCNIVWNIYWKANKNTDKGCLRSNSLEKQTFFEMHAGTVAPVVLHSCILAYACGLSIFIKNCSV